jgi:hypothetical protein
MGRVSIVSIVEVRGVAAELTHLNRKVVKSQDLLVNQSIVRHVMIYGWMDD